MTNSRYDLVVFGATSFVGQILTGYLVQHLSTVSESVHWAMAGRSESKLKQVQASISGAESIPLIIADASDEAALQAMCEQTRVVISTVGPYALYGELLVKTCVETGTDYCDLAGELQWIRQMIAKYGKAGRRSGARIVHSCGFDSIPFDLGVAFLQKKAREKWDMPCTSIKMRVKAAKGGVSGGTVASILNVAREALSDSALRRELTDPYSLCPPDHGFTVRQTSQKTAVFDEDFKSWTAPFVMEALNTRVVHRSNALLGHAYGDFFLYDEAVLTGAGLKGRLTASKIVTALAVFFAGVAVPPSRWVMQKFILPKPGEGPSPKVQQNGFFDLRFVGWTIDGKEIRTKVTGDHDPGYGSTAKMLGQAGISLAFDISKEEKAGGFWTTATIFDDRMLNRLMDYAGLGFEVTA